METPSTIKVVTWNVNSARARLERIKDFLRRHSPDVVCLQEIKSTDKTFPFEAVAQAGYRAAIYGQPAYNGVAFLSRTEADNVETGLDDQARVIAASFFGIRFVCVYVPNGQRIGSDKHAYKLQWLDGLGDFLQFQADIYGEFVVTGDFNVAPNDLDVAHPDEWDGKILCDPAARDKLSSLVERFRLTDVLRKHAGGAGVYTWWDYRTRAFQWNDGVRIDHIYATPGLADRTAQAWVDLDERDGKLPSDHAPVFARLVTLNGHPAR